MATPANFDLTFTIQDNRGFRSLASFRSFIPDIESTGEVLDDIWTGVDGVRVAVAAMSNAKVVGVDFGYKYAIAQEPTSETGVYELVQQKAKLQGGDGNGGFMSVEIPAPKDALFLTTASENLVVVNPAASILTAMQSSLTVMTTARGGHPFQLFFGGQLVEGKPRRRRVLQGA